MAKKSVYAAIEIADREVRLVVLEIFSARNNILRVERVSHNGIRNGQIADEGQVAAAVEQAVSQAQNALGYRIERVLLTIPARNVQTSSQRVHLTIEDGTHTIRLFHVQQGLKSAMQKKNENGLELANIGRITYYIDDRPVTKIPLGQDATDFDMEVDLLYTDKELLYSYARVIEKAGLQILDICLDSFAQAKETAALELSKEKSVILISLEADHTTLTYLSDGRVVSVAVMDKGYSSFIKDLQQQYDLSDATAWRLLQNLFHSREMDAPGTVIYIEQQEDRRVEITARDLAASVLPALRSWIAEVNAACRPIISSAPSRYMITGQGSSIPVLERMETAFNAPASVYTVTDIGARDGAYTAALGLAYAWSDINAIRHEEKTSVNNNELEASIESITRYGKGGEGGFTRKLKRAMLSNRE